MYYAHISTEYVHGECELCSMPVPRNSSRVHWLEIEIVVSRSSGNTNVFATLCANFQCNGSATLETKHLDESSAAAGTFSLAGS